MLNGNSNSHSQSHNWSLAEIVIICICISYWFLFVFANSWCPSAFEMHSLRWLPPHPFACQQLPALNLRSQMDSDGSGSESQFWLGNNWHSVELSGGRVLIHICISGLIDDCAAEGIFSFCFCLNSIWFILQDFPRWWRFFEEPSKIRLVQNHHTVKLYLYFPR